MRAAVVGMVLLCFLGCSGRDASLEQKRLELERQHLVTAATGCIPGNCWR